jgi:hypothetical protein
MPEYFITPRQPGVRPQDPPDYDGITFVYVFTYVLDPWTQPPVGQNVVLVVANAQGLVPGMTVMIENGGYYEVVETTALDRLTVMNYGWTINQPPGTGIFPGKLTTTSLPGPPGQPGPVGPPGPPLEIKGTVPDSSHLPPTGQPGDVWITANDGHGWAWSGTQWIDIGPIQGPPGPAGQPAYTTNTSNFTIPAVGSSVTATVADASWMTVGEYVWVAGANGSGQAGELLITAISGNQVTLFNPTVPPGGVPEAPTDGYQYARKNAAWSVVAGGSGSAAIVVWGEIPTGSINSTNKSYTAAYPFVAGLLAVFLNGLRQRHPDDYSETTAQSFTFVNAPITGDSVSIDYTRS